MQQRHSRSRCVREDSRVVMEALRVRATLFFTTSSYEVEWFYVNICAERWSSHTLQNLLIALHKKHKETSVTVLMTRAYQAGYDDGDINSKKSFQLTSKHHDGVLGVPNDANLMITGNFCNRGSASRHLPQSRFVELVAGEVMLCLTNTKLTLLHTRNDRLAGICWGNASECS